MDEGRPVVRPAGVGELELLAERAPAAGPVEPELDLLPHRGRMERVERAPREDVPAAAACPVREHRLAVARNLELDVGGIPVDQLRRRGRSGERELTTTIDSATRRRTTPPSEIRSDGSSIGAAAEKLIPFGGVAGGIGGTSLVAGVRGRSEADAGRSYR